MIILDTWTAIGGLASVVAAAAALVTIIYARATVHEARQTRDESHQAHLEEMTDRRAAAETSAVMHHDEMQARDRALAAELSLQRIVQVGRVVDALLDLVDTARKELDDPPPLLSRDHPIRMTRIPHRQMQLRVAVELLDRLGGPTFAKTQELAKDAFIADGRNPTAVISAGTTALTEINTVVESDVDGTRLLATRFADD